MGFSFELNFQAWQVEAVVETVKSTKELAEVVASGKEHHPLDP